MNVMNNMPAGMRLTVALVGSRNAGKSSLFNQILGQEVAIVSAEKGTTTDAVVKAYELVPLGAVSFYDTAGIDDVGELGALRKQATKKVLARSDAVLLVIGRDGVDETVEKQLAKLSALGGVLIPVFNFADERELSVRDREICEKFGGVVVSARSGLGIEELKQKLIEKLEPLTKEPPLVRDMISVGDVVVLVTPIDLAAPRGRLILPQVQVLRDILDANAVAITVKEDRFEQALKNLATKPKLVITDSQVVKKVADVLPSDIKLTTFSILFSRHKGDFEAQLEGVKKLDALNDGDKVLIAEGCSHHITCNDIGRVKLPAMIKNYTAKKLEFDFTQGNDFPEDVSQYSLVILCGGCMLNRAEVRRRIEICKENRVAVTNYGMVFVKGQGVKLGD